MNRGYSGYYKGYYLRSSFEYAYAYYLDLKGIEWRYEEKLYKFDDFSYKPDFSIYENGKLLYIAETKSGCINEINEARTRLERIKNEFNINYQLITYDVLKKLYDDLGLNVDDIIKQWKESPDTSPNMKFKGKFNPHYGRQHTEAAKKKISIVSKKNWQNPEIRERMLEGLRKGTETMKNKPKKKVEIEYRVCPECNVKFKTRKNSRQKYCSQRCAYIAGARKGNEVYIQNRNKELSEVAKITLAWALDNKHMFENVKMNKLKPIIDPLIEEVSSKTSISDIRTICKAVLGKDKGRKALIEYLKDYVTMQ